MAFFLSCNRNDSVVPLNTSLDLISSDRIDVLEASGLAINSSGTALYTVSDNTTNIYKLSTAGTVLHEYSYNGNDVEGITMVSNNKALLVEERTKEIVEYDLNSKNVIKNELIYDNNDSNSGLEGIAFNFNDNTIFVLNEKYPGLLMILRNDFTIIQSYELDFASDYSGIFHDRTLNCLWILSDQSKTVNKCNLNGMLIKSYSIEVNKAEGIAVTDTVIYVVTDSSPTLYRFKKPVE